MNPSRLVLAFAALLSAGCFDEPVDDSGVVFDDVFPEGSGYQPFANSKLDAVMVDGGEVYAGEASLRFTVPTPGEPGAGAFGFSGGAVTSDVPRDLSRYNALTFYAKASRPTTLNSFGLANDNTGTSRYQTETRDLPIGVSWKRYVIPIPAPNKLTRERGLFWLADGAKGDPPSGYVIWFDDIRFEEVDASTWLPRPALADARQEVGPGETVQIAGTSATYTLDGEDRRIDIFPASFDFRVSDPGVLRVDPFGLVTALDLGEAEVTGTLNGAPAEGSVRVSVQEGLAPGEPPPAPPARDAGDVIGLLTTVYEDVPVDTWGTSWSNLEQGPNLTELTIGGDEVKRYADLLYIGVEFTGDNLIDATAMTTLHLDLWTPDATEVKVKLVDFGADGAFAGGDDAEVEVPFGSPPLAQGAWVGIDMPLGTLQRGRLAQLILSSSRNTVYVSNVYFYR